MYVSMYVCMYVCAYAFILLANFLENNQLQGGENFWGDTEKKLLFTNVCQALAWEKSTLI